MGQALKSFPQLREPGRGCQEQGKCTQAESTRAFLQSHLLQLELSCRNQEERLLTRSYQCRYNVYITGWASILQSSYFPSSAVWVQYTCPLLLLPVQLRFLGACSSYAAFSYFFLHLLSFPCCAHREYASFPRFASLVMIFQMKKSVMNGFLFITRTTTFIK